MPMANYPSVPFSGYFGFVAIADVACGHMEHRQTPTRRSISGSNKVGFNYQCAQARGCSNLELSSRASLGMAGDPTLHGAQWIKGGTTPGGQMVPGGEGVLGAIDNGMEPTGRLPFGLAFKVVLTDTDESEGLGKFGLYFRVCHRGIPDLGCTPYFIGPVPWFSVHEKAKFLQQFYTNFQPEVTQTYLKIFRRVLVRTSLIDFQSLFYRWLRRDLNLRPWAYESPALTY